MPVAFSKASLDRLKLHDLPNSFLEHIIKSLETYHNETVDFSPPQLRPVFTKIYPLFLLLYGLLVVLGTAGNLAMVTHLLRRRRYRDPICTYLMNLGVCNLIMDVLLLPISLAVLLIQNWVFGSFLCYFVPMLQDAPLHATLGTHVMISVARYLEIVCPQRPRPSPFIAILAIWVASVCIVLPYFVYVCYLDLESLLGKQFVGVGLCIVNLRDDVDDYTRGLFAVTYICPLALTAFFHIRASSELKKQEAPVPLATMQGQGRLSQHDIWSLPDNNPGSNSALTEADGRESFLQQYSEGTSNTSLTTGGRTARSSIHLKEEETQQDVAREKRNQRYLISILATTALCLCPLMILRLVKNMVLETYQNTGYFDVTFISFVWVAFLPTVTTPAIFALWRVPGSAKDRIRDYLGSNRRRSEQMQGFAPVVPPSNSRAAHRLSLDHTNIHPGVLTPILSRANHTRDVDHLRVLDHGRLVPGPHGRPSHRLSLDYTISSHMNHGLISPVHGRPIRGRSGRSLSLALPS